jgi:hypothetical protein
VNFAAVTEKAIWGGCPHEQPIFVVKSLCRAAPPARPVLYPLCALRVSFPASKYIYIDAFRHESVTRQTLLRYTEKSTAVNALVVETCGSFSVAKGVERCLGPATSQIRCEREANGDVKLYISNAKAVLEALPRRSNLHSNPDGEAQVLPENQAQPHF